MEGEKKSSKTCKFCKKRVIIEGFAESETRFDSGIELRCVSKKSEKKFDGLEKIVLEFKASLITASSAKIGSKEFVFAAFVKNIQPISVGV